MLRHVGSLKKKTTDRLHGYCCLKYPSYAAWHEHPYHTHTHWFLVIIFLTGWVMGLFFQLHFFPLRSVGAAAYTFVQSSWAGGATANNANHTSHRTGWTEFASKDTQLTAGATATLTAQSGTYTENFQLIGPKDTTNSTARWDNIYEQVSLKFNDNHWASKTSFPDPPRGVLIPSGGSTYLYALRGRGTSTFSRYDIAGDSWSDAAVADAPATIAGGIGSSSGILVGSDTIYALGGSTKFYKYTISTDTWSTLAVTPASVSTGALGYPGSGDCMYLLNGSRFDAYSIANDNWNSSCTNPTDPPATTGSGVSLAWANVSGYTTYLFAFRGNNTDDFWTYSTTNNNWTTLDPPDPAKAISQGGSLAWANRSGVTDFLFATRGNMEREIFAYSLSNNNWTTYSPQYIHESTPTASITDSSGLFAGAGFVYPGAGDYLYTAKGNSSDSTTESRFLSFLLPFTHITPQIVQTTAIDTTTQAIASATLTATHTLNGQTITYQMSRDGGVTWENVTSGELYTFTSTQAEQSDLRWKATLSTTNTAISPVITGITITYNYYSSSQVLTSSQFNTEASTAQATQIAWSETIPSGTNVRLQIRTAPDSNGSPGTWSDWLGPTNASDYYETTPAGETVNSINRSGGDDQWMQYRAYLTSTGVNTPTLSSATISYSTFPAAPSLSSSSHPSQTTFYPSATPTITITAGTPAPNHYNYFVNQTTSPSISIFDNDAGTRVDTSSFTLPSGSITSDGTWYLHLIAHDSGHANSASFATYTIKYDGTAPTSTTLSFGSITASSITASASASDVAAGLHATPFYYDRNSGAANSDWITGNWTDTGLAVNTQYSYRVKARDATATPNESAFTATQSKYTAANIPSAPSVTSPTASTLKVTVQKNDNPSGPAPAGDTEYVIAVSTDNFALDTRFVQADGTVGASAAWRTYSQWNGTSGITVTSLTANTTYTFKVKARNGDNLETSYSSSSSSYTAANAPSNFRATTTGSTSATIEVDRFSGDTQGQAGYSFSRSGASSGWITTNTWTDTGLSPNTTYTYSVKTRDQSAVESGTSTLDVATAAATPSAPTIDATTASDTTVRITVNAGSNPSSTAHAIYESTQNKYVQANGTLGASAAWQTASQWGTIVVTGLTANTRYQFAVKARNSANSETGVGSGTSVYTLAIPGAITFNDAAATRTRLQMTFTAASTNSPSTEYAIQETTGSQYVQTNGTLGASVAWQTASQWGTVTVTGLSAGTTYTFRVKARNSLQSETSFGSSTSGTTLAAGVPRAPTLPGSGRTATSLVIVIDTTDLEASREYAIFETGQSKYVQADGTLGNTPVWQTYAQWGSTTGTAILGLQPRLQYTVKVKSRDPNAGNVESSFSPTVSETTSGGTGDTTPPALPGTITTRITNDKHIAFRWTDPSDIDFVRVSIFRSATDAPPGSTPYAVVTRGIGTFVDRDVSSGAFYAYYLRFEDAAGNGALSELIRVTVPRQRDGSSISDSTQSGSQQEQERIVEERISEIPIPESQPTSSSTTDTDINLKELIRVQYPTSIVAQGAEDGCLGGQFICSLNRLFSIERIPGFDFVVDKLVTNKERQESARARQKNLTAASPVGNATILGRFGLLYDVIPSGVSVGASLAQPVKITLRYNPRDASLIVRSENNLALAYLNAATNQWEIIADAAHDSAEGTFTASVTKAGTYGIVIMKTATTQ